MITSRISDDPRSAQRSRRLILLAAVACALGVIGRHCWTAKRLAAGKSVTYRLAVRVLASASGHKINRAVAAAPHA